MQLGFPAERLLEMRKAGGPLAPRYHTVMSGLLRGSPVFEFSPEEAIAMRDWWLSLPRPETDDHGSRAGCVALIDQAFGAAKRCLRCGGELARQSPASWRCPKCG